jgi:hypothetical protein
MGENGLVSIGILMHNEFINFIAWAARHTLHHRKIRLIESNAKCRYLKKLTYKGTLRQVFICLWPPLLLGFLFGMVKQFCIGPETGQIQSGEAHTNMIYKKY